MSALARRIYLNPADKQSGYVLWGNGYIEPFGYALPVKQKEGSINDWPSQEAPTFYLPLACPNPAIALHIINWNIPSGYTLTVYGHVWAWGGVSPVPGAVPPLTGGPEYYLGTSGGFSSTVLGYVSDFEMDPAGNGRGYFLQYNGDVIPFGTGVTNITHAACVFDTWAMQLEMDWASKRYWILDNKGRIYGRNGGNDVGYDGQAAGLYVWGREGHGLRLYDKAATPKGHMLDKFGRLHRVGAAADVYGAPFNVFWPMDIWRDFEYVDDGTGVNPIRIVPLSVSGERPEFVQHTPPVAPVGYPISGSTITSTKRPWIQWTYIDLEGDLQKQAIWGIYNDGQYLAGAVNEVQRITITGTPTGGTFTLTVSFNGQVCTTAPIAYNASAGTVQAALELLPNVKSGNVSCGGGALPGAFVTVTFQNVMGAYDHDQMVAVGSFSGGSSPAVTVTTTTAGVGIDIFNVSAFATGPVITDPAITRARPSVDLPNDTYRAYLMVVDSTDQTIFFRFYTQWIQNALNLNQPTITPTVIGGNQGVRLLVHATTGAGLPAGSKFCVQYHDSDWDSINWYNLRDGDALAPDGSGNATVVDRSARFGVVRSYRAITYTYDTIADDFNGSDYSATQIATLGPRSQWVLANTYTTDSIECKVQPGFETSFEVGGAKFQPIGRPYPIVLTDGAPKAPAFDLNLWALNNNDRTKIEQILQSGQVLHLRDPFGQEWYFKVWPGYSKPLMRASPLKTEVTSIRDAHEFKISCQTVKRPLAGPTVGPLVEAI